MICIWIVCGRVRMSVPHFPQTFSGILSHLIYDLIASRLLYSDLDRAESSFNSNTAIVCLLESCPFYHMKDCCEIAIPHLFD